MNSKLENYLLSLLEREKDWKVEKLQRRGPRDPQWGVLTQEGDRFPLAHPYRIHITLYRTSVDMEMKYRHMKAAHDYLWPHMVATWNDWDERRFRAHCAGYNHISYAGGAGVAKSNCAARIAILFYVAAPKGRAVIVSSVTADSLETRIWGYIQEFLSSSAIQLPIKILESKPPRVLPMERAGKIYGMFATAVREGEDAKVIATIIGRHPKGGIMFILDEAPEMNAAIIQSIANLRKGTSFWQVVAIGNSRSVDDLHGALSTPKRGWKSINPLRDDFWETTHENGICLYFNPYKSPAITDPDAEKRQRLAKFLPTEKSIAEDKVIYGAGSENFYRMTLGFWKMEGGEGAMSSRAFLSEHEIHKRAEWSGFYPVHMVGGYDSAFKFGDTGAVLRLAYYGHTTDGLMCLDYRGEELVFRLSPQADTGVSSELQIARQLVTVLRKYKVPLYRVAFDVTGSGRAMAEVVRGVMQTEYQPIKVSFTGLSKEIMPKKGEVAMITGRPDSFWLKFREFVQKNQVKGLDEASIAQFSSRQILQDPKRPGYSRLETKQEYKARMSAINPRLAHSPDEADAAILALFAAIVGFGLVPGMRRETPVADRDSRAEQKMRAMEAVREGSMVRGPQFSPTFGAQVEDLARLKRG